MYVFMVDIPLNVLLGIALAVHLVEFVLLLHILRKIKSRGHA